MTTVQLADAEATRRWLTAGLDLCRVGPTGVDALDDAAPLLASAASQLSRLPPPGALVDLARLCLDPRAALSSREPVRLAATLRPYEDAVLGRIATDPLRLAVADALAGLAEERRADGVVVVLEHLLQRVGFDAGVAPHPGAVRELDRITGEDWLALAGEPSGSSLLEDGYRALTTGFRAVGRLLVPGDVTVIEQLPLLARRSDRLALSQVLTMVDRLSRTLPRRARATRRRAGHVSTKLLDDSAYPVGGFSSISTSGSIENLVTSELALMEDGAAIDLFDVRLMEGELLYYTRDETAFVRGRRRFVVELRADLQNARFRDPGLPVQRIVLALAWTVALVTTLLRWLDREDLLIRIALPPDGLEEERRLLTWALADGLHTGTVTLEVGGDPLGRVVSDARVAPVDHIVLQVAPTPVPPLQDAWTTVLQVADIPTVTTPFAGPHPPADEPFDGWCHTLVTALTELL